MTNVRSAAAIGAALIATACVSTMLAGPAQASHGGGGRTERASGTCVNGAGTWKLKAKADDGLIAIEFEVDTNRVGQRWHVRITDNGATVRDRVATTVAPSGSFSLHPHTTNRAGTDVIRARATRGDRVCAGVVRF